MGDAPEAGEHETEGKDSASLARSLAPAMREACNGQLSDIEWFRSTWQAGGAATGYANWTDGNQTRRAIIKLPVGPTEFRWTTDASDAASDSQDCPTPRVFASGSSIAGHDLCWLVVERLSGPPLSRQLSKQSISDLLDALVRWYTVASKVRPIDELPPRADWDRLLSKSRVILKDAPVEEAQRWNEAVRRAQRALPILERIWTTRTINSWCHGDLHPGNAMRRACEDSEGPCVLIDLALVHAGHWVEDAVFLERLFWGRKDLLGGIKPPNHLARLRRKAGLEVEDDYASLCQVRRAMTAACVPVYLAREGDPVYVRAAIGILERSLDTLGA